MLVPLPTSGSGFEPVDLETCKPHQTQRADPQHLESVPNAQQDKHIEPSWAAIIDDLYQDCRDQEVWDRQQHRWHTPFETARSEEHTSELQSRGHIVCRLLL